MQNSQNQQKKEHPSTYFVQDRQSQRELTRVSIQDQMLTTSMGGVLPEQAEPASFKRVLDVGCGTGNWAIEAAQTYPTMSLAGIDVSQSMVEYARAQAAEQQLSERVEFRVMDALRMIEFPSNYFDLVNMRFAGSFLRTWEWPRIISELSRVTRPGGVVRITDPEVFSQSTSPAHQQFFTMFMCAFYRSGHLFEEETTGMTAHLVPLLKQHGSGKVQSKKYPLEYWAGTPAGQAYIENVQHAFSTTRPFIQKWGCLSQDCDAICQQALKDMQQSDFHTTWNLLTAWYIKDEK